MLKTSHHKLAHSLKKKGWKSKHIAKIRNIMEKNEKNKHPQIKKMDNRMHLHLFLILIFANVVALTAILPFLIGTPEWFVAIIVSIIGLCVGSLIDGAFSEFE